MFPPPSILSSADKEFILEFVELVTVKFFRVGLESEQSIIHFPLSVLDFNASLFVSEVPVSVSALVIVCVVPLPKVIVLPPSPFAVKVPISLLPEKETESVPVSSSSPFTVISLFTLTAPESVRFWNVFSPLKVAGLFSSAERVIVPVE